MMTAECCSDALRDEYVQFDSTAALHALALPQFSGLEHLLDRGEQAIRIGAHCGVEMLALQFIDRMSLQRIQIKPHTRNRGLKLMRNGVQKGVLPLIPPDLANQKDCVQDYT